MWPLRFPSVVAARFERSRRDQIVVRALDECQSPSLRVDNIVGVVVPSVVHGIVGCSAELLESFGKNLRVLLGNAKLEPDVPNNFHTLVVRSTVAG